MPAKAKKTRIAEFDGVSIRVLTRNEHCGPHVHVFHEGEAWELRIFFSFASDRILKVQLEAGALPKRKVVQKCMDAVIDNLDECRRQFWEGVGLDCCLVNQHVVIDKDGYIWETTADAAGALRVSKARYLADRCSLELTAHGRTFTGMCP
jgi:hypothetical protein